MDMEGNETNILDYKGLRKVLNKISLFISNNKQTAGTTDYSNQKTKLQANNVQDAIDQLFTSVSNGKELLASAITDKGVTTAKDASLEVMAQNVSKISTAPVYAWWSPVMTSDSAPSPFKCSASSIYYSTNYRNPYFAFDNKANNVQQDGWQCTTTDSDPWIMFDFGSTVDFYGVRCKTRTFTSGDTAQQFPKTIFIDISSDGTSFSTIYQQRDIPKQTTRGIFAFTYQTIMPAQTRYVRLSKLALDGKYGDVVGMSEINFLLQKDQIKGGAIVG